MQNPKYEQMKGSSKVPIRTSYITRVTENSPTNFKFKVLQPYFDEEFSSHDPRSIALECLRRVKCRKKCAREVPVFADTVRNFVTYIHNYNMTVLKSSSVYPYCEEFSELLHQYVLLECQILYKIPYYSKVREIQVQTRILRILINIYTDYFRSKMIPSKEVMEKSAKAIFDIFIELKLNYPKANYKILENMTVILLKRIGRYEKINALKGKRLSSVKDPDLSIFSMNVISSGYGTDESSNEPTTQPSIGIDVEEGTSSGDIEENPVIIKEESDNLEESTRNPNSKLVWTICPDDENPADDIYFLDVEIQSKRETRNKNSQDAKSISENVVRKDKEKKYTAVSTMKPKSSDSFKKSTNKTIINNILKANYLSDRLNQLDAILDSANKEEIEEATDDEDEDSKPDIRTLLIKKETRKIDVDSETNHLPMIQTNVPLKMADETPLVRIPSYNNRLKATNQNMETIIEIEEDEETTRIQEAPKLIDIIDLIDSDDEEEEISNLNTNPDSTKPLTSENIEAICEANEDANDVSSSSLILTLKKFVNPEESKCDNGISTTTEIGNLTNDDVTVQIINNSSHLEASKVKPLKNEETTECQTVNVPDSSKLPTNDNIEEESVIEEEGVKESTCSTSEDILTEEGISGVEDSFTGRNISRQKVLSIALDRLTDKHDDEESTIEKYKLVPINEKEEIVAEETEDKIEDHTEEDELLVNDTNNVQTTKEELKVVTEENKLVQANSEEIIDEDPVQISNLHLTIDDKIVKSAINEERDKEDHNSSSIADINNKEIKESELIETNDTEETLKDQIEGNTEDVVVKEENKSIQTTREELKVITEEHSINLEEIIDEDPTQMENFPPNSPKLKNYEEIVESIINEESKEIKETINTEETLKDSINIEDFEDANEHLDKNKITKTNNSEEEERNLNEVIEDPNKIDQSEDKKDLHSSSTTDIKNQKIEETNVDFEEIEVKTLNDQNLQNINEEIEETIGEINTNIEDSRSSSISDINNEDIKEKNVDFKEKELIETKNTEDIEVAYLNDPNLENVNEYIEEIVITDITLKENEVDQANDEENLFSLSSTDINNEEIEVMTNLENINEETVARDINLENNKVDRTKNKIEHQSSSSTEKIEESNAGLEENELISEEIKVITLKDAQLETINEETVILEENKEDIEESNAGLEENELISEEIEDITLKDAQLENINEDIEETVILEENKEDIEESNAGLEENELISEEIEVITSKDAQLENINEIIEETVILEENKEDIQESNAALEENELISEEIEVITLKDAQLENINEDNEETVILEENKEDIEESNAGLEENELISEEIEVITLKDAQLENINEDIEETVYSESAVILEENQLEENELIESKNIGTIEEQNSTSIGIEERNVDLNETNNNEKIEDVVSQSIHLEKRSEEIEDNLIETNKNEEIAESDKDDIINSVSFEETIEFTNTKEIEETIDDFSSNAAHLEIVKDDTENAIIEETNLHFEGKLIETNNNEEVNSISTNLEDTNEESKKIKETINNELVQTNDSEDLVVENLTSYRNNEEIIEAQINNEDLHLEIETEENCDIDFTQIENTQQSDKGKDKIDANIHINTEQEEEEEENTNNDIEMYVEIEETKDENEEKLESSFISNDEQDIAKEVYIMKNEEFTKTEIDSKETEDLIKTEGILCKPLEEYTKFEKQMFTNYVDYKNTPHNTVNETPVVESEHSKMLILAIVAEMKRKSEEKTETPRRRAIRSKAATKTTEENEERRITRSVSKKRHPESDPSIFQSILRPQDFKTALPTKNVTIHQLPDSHAHKASTDNDSSDSDSDNMLFIDEKKIEDHHHHRVFDNEISIYDEDSLEENLQFSYESRIQFEPLKKSKTKFQKLKTMAQRKLYDSPYVVIERLNSKNKQDGAPNTPPEDPDVILTKLPKKLQRKYSKKSLDNNLEETTIINKNEEKISNSSISPTLPAKLRNKRGNSIMTDPVKIDLSNCKNPVKTITEKLGKRLENEIKIGFIDLDPEIPTAVDPDDVPLTLRLQNKEKVSENASLHPKKNINIISDIILSPKRVNGAILTDPKIEIEENLHAPLSESSLTNTNMNESQITPGRRSFTFEEPEIDQLIEKYTKCKIVHFDNVSTHSIAERTQSGSLRSSRSKSCTTKLKKIDEGKKSRSKSLTDRRKNVQTISRISTGISEDDLEFKSHPVDTPKTKGKNLRSMSSIALESKEFVQTVTDSTDDIYKDNWEFKSHPVDTPKRKGKNLRSTSSIALESKEFVQTVTGSTDEIYKDNLEFKSHPVDTPKRKEKNLRSMSSIALQSKEFVQTVTDSSDDIYRDNLEIKSLSKEPSKTERKRTSGSRSLSSHAIDEDNSHPVDPPKVEGKNLRSRSLSGHESNEIVQTVTAINEDNLEFKSHPVDTPKIKGKNLRSTSSIALESKEFVQTVTDSSDDIYRDNLEIKSLSKEPSKTERKRTSGSRSLSSHAIDEDNSHPVDPPKVEGKNLRSRSLSGHESNEIVQTVTAINEDKLEFKSRPVNLPKIEGKNLRSRSLSGHESNEIVQTVTAINEDNLELKSRLVDPPKIEGKNLRSRSLSGHESNEIVQTVTAINEDKLEFKSRPVNPPKIEGKNLRSRSLSGHENNEIVQTVTAINEDNLELKSRLVDPPKIEGKNLRSRSLYGHESNEIVQTVTAINEDNLELKSRLVDPPKIKGKNLRSWSLSGHESNEIVQTVTAINEDKLEFKSRPVNLPKIEGKNLRSSSLYGHESNEIVQTVTAINEDNLELKSRLVDPPKIKGKNLRSWSLSGHESNEIVQTVTAINEDNLELKSRLIDPPKIEGKNLRSRSLNTREGKEIVQTVTDTDTDVYKDLEIKSFPAQPSKTEGNIRSIYDCCTTIDEDYVESESSAVDLLKLEQKSRKSKSVSVRESKVLSEDNLVLKCSSVDPPKSEGKKLRSRSLSAHTNTINKSCVEDSPKIEGKKSKTKEIIETSITTNADDLEPKWCPAESQIENSNESKEFVEDSYPLESPKTERKHLRTKSLTTHETKEIIENMYNEDSKSYFLESQKTNYSTVEKKLTSRSSKSEYKSVKTEKTYQERRTGRRSKFISKRFKKSKFTRRLEKKVSIRKTNKKRRVRENIAEAKKTNEDIHEIEVIVAETIPNLNDRSDSIHKKTNIVKSKEEEEIPGTEENNESSNKDSLLEKTIIEVVENENHHEEALTTIAEEFPVTQNENLVIEEEEIAEKSLNMDSSLEITNVEVIENENHHEEALTTIAEECPITQNENLVIEEEEIAEKRLNMDSSPENTNVEVIENENHHEEALTTVIEEFPIPQNENLEIEEEIAEKSLNMDSSPENTKVEVIENKNYHEEALTTIAEECPITQNENLVIEEEEIAEKSLNMDSSPKNTNVEVFENENHHEEALTTIAEECPITQNENLVIEEEEIAEKSLNMDSSPKNTNVEVFENENHHEEALTTIAKECPITQNENLVIEEEEIAEKSLNMDSSLENTNVEVIENKNHREESLTTIAEECPITQNENFVIEEEEIAEKSLNMDSSPENINVEVIQNENHHGEALTTIVEEFPVPQNENLKIEEEEIAEKSLNMDSSLENTNVEVIENENHHEEALTTIAEECPITQNENLVIEEEEIAEKNLNMDSSPENTNVEVIENENHHEEALTTIAEEYPITQNENLVIEEEEIAEKSLNMDSSPENTNVKVIENENHHEEALTTVVEEFPVTQNENLVIEEEENCEKTNIEGVENENYQEEALTTDIEECPIPQNENLVIEKDKITEESSKKDSSSEETNIEVIENENNHVEALRTFVEECPVTENENLEIKDEKVPEKSLNVTKNVQSEDVVSKEHHNSAFAEPVYEKINDSPLDNMPKKVTTSDLIKKLRGQQKKSKKRTKKSSSENKVPSSDAFPTQLSSDTTEIERNSSVLSVDNNNTVHAAVLAPKTNEMEGLIDNKSETKSSLPMDQEELQNVDSEVNEMNLIENTNEQNSSLVYAIDTKDHKNDDKDIKSSLVFPVEEEEVLTPTVEDFVDNKTGQISVPKELEHLELSTHIENQKTEYTQLLKEIPANTKENSIIDDKKSNSSSILPVATKERETCSLILPVPNKELEHPELLSRMKNEQSEYTQILTEVSAKISEIENSVEENLDDTHKGLTEAKNTELKRDEILIFETPIEDEKRDYTEDEPDDILTMLDKEIRNIENSKNQVKIQPVQKEVFDHNRFFTQPKVQIGDLLKIKENCNISKHIQSQSWMSSNKEKKTVKKRKQSSSSAEPLCKKCKSSATDLKNSYALPEPLKQEPKKDIEENNTWEVPNASFDNIDNSFNQLIPYPMPEANDFSGEELTKAISLTDSTSTELDDNLPSDIVEFLKTYVRMYPNNNNVYWNPPPAISIVSSHTTTISNYPMAENNLFSPEQNRNGGYATFTSTSKKEITFNFNGPFNQNTGDNSQGVSVNDNLATDHCYSQAAQMKGNSKLQQLKAITSGTNDHNYNTRDPLMSMGYGNNLFGLELLEDEESLNRRGQYANWDIEPKVIVVPNEQYKSETIDDSLVTEFKTPDDSLVDEDWEEAEESLKNTQTPVENVLVPDQWVESVPIKNIEVEIPFTNHENSCSTVKQETYDSADNLYNIILNNATSAVPPPTATPLIPDLWEIPFNTETPHESVTDQWQQNTEVKNLSFYTTHFTDTEESNHSEELNPVEDITSGPNSEPIDDITPVQDNADADTSSSKNEETSVQDNADADTSSSKNEDAAAINDTGPSGVSSKIKQLINLHKKIQNKNQSVSKSKRQNPMVIPSRQYSRTIPSDWTRSPGTSSPVLASSKTDKPADPTDSPSEYDTHNEGRESVVTADSSGENKEESLVKQELLMSSHKSAIADSSIANKKDLLEVVKTANKQEIGRRSPRIYEQNESKRNLVKSEAKQNNVAEESSSANEKDSLQVINAENKEEIVTKEEIGTSRTSEAKKRPKNASDDNSNRSDINKIRNTSYLETNRTKPVTAKEIPHSNGLERPDKKLVERSESSAKDKPTTRSKVSLSDTQSSKYVSVDSTLRRKSENVRSNRRLGENKFDEKSYSGSSDSPQSISPELSSFEDNSVTYSSLYDNVKSRKRQATKKPIENTVESHRLRRKATPDIQSSYGKSKTYFDYNKPLGNSKHYSNSGSSSSYHSVDNGSSRDEKIYQKDPKKSKRPACDEFNDKRKIQKTENFDRVYDKLWRQGNINPHLKFPHNQTGTSTSKNQRYETTHSGHKRSSSGDLNYGSKRKSSGSSCNNNWKNGDRGTSKGPQRYSSFRPPSDSSRSHQESSHPHPESRPSYPSYSFRDNREPNYFPRSGSSSNKMPPTVSPSNRPPPGSSSSSRAPPPPVYNCRAPPPGSTSSSRVPPPCSSGSSRPPPPGCNRAPPPGPTSSSGRAPHVRPTTRAPPAGYTFGAPPTGYAFEEPPLGSTNGRAPSFSSASNRSQVPIFCDDGRSQAPNSHSNASPGSSQQSPLSEEKQSKLLEDLKKIVQMQKQTQKSKTKNKNPSNMEWYQQMGTILSETNGSLGMNRRD